MASCLLCCCSFAFARKSPLLRGAMVLPYKHMPRHTRSILALPTEATLCLRIVCQTMSDFKTNSLYTCVETKCVSSRQGDDFDHTIRILLLGDSGVGKTSLMTRFSEDKFAPTMISTAGVDFKVLAATVRSPTSTSEELCFKACGHRGGGGVLDKERGKSGMPRLVGWVC